MLKSGQKSSDFAVFGRILRFLGQNPQKPHLPLNLQEDNIK